MRNQTSIFRAFLTGLLLILTAPVHLTAQQLNAVQNYGMNRPGVVMVRTVFSADVYVNKIQLDERHFNHLVDSIQKVDSSGIIYTPEQKLDIVLKEINNSPNRFFKASLDYIKEPEEITSSGTGFLITPDGYVATNCHLIDRDNAFIRRQFFLSAFQQITQANIAALENAWATKFSEQQKSILYNTYASVYARLFSMSLFDLKKDIYIEYSVDTDSGRTSSIKKSAHVIIKGQPMPGKDIAILKMDGDSTLPTLKVGQDELPRVGEQLFVYGFPGPVTNNNFLATESAIEPTLTTGIVSAIKKSTTGWPIIQMDANINKGSSGGPVCNEKGEVVGMTTFGSLENTGGLAAGLNFAIPVSILQEFLDSAGVMASPGETSLLFGEAVVFYNREYYKDALKKFLQVNELNNRFPGLAFYISDSKKRLLQTEEKKSSMMRSDLMIFGVLLLIAIMIFRYFRQKSIKTKA